MKKLLSFGMIFSIIISVLSGCSAREMSNSEIDKLLKSAFSKTEKLVNINVINKNDISYEFGTETYSVTTEIGIMEANIGNKDKYEMSTEVTNKIMGAETSYETYYKDGFFYTSRYGGKFKTKTDLEELNKGSTVELFKVKLDDMKTVTTRTVKETTSGDEEELLYISFTCKNKVLKEYIAAAFSDNDTNFESASITGSKGEYVINKDGYIVSESLNISANILIDGEETASIISSKTVYSDIGESVDPYDPEDSEYSEVAEISNVMALDSALNKTLSANSMDISMEMETDIEQDETKAGYKRSYSRKMSVKDEVFAHEETRTYTDGEKYSDDIRSTQYYTDGKFYTSSEMTGLKICSDMEFKSFTANIYRNPVDVYSTGMMKSIEKSEEDNNTVYTFEFNPSSDEGIYFLQMLFTPYDRFDGDLETAEVVTDSFVGKVYVNDNGEFYKISMECDLDLKFEQGDTAVSCTQTIKVNSINREEINIKFPEFKDYEEWDEADLISAFTS